MSEKTLSRLLIAPIVSEKSTASAERQGAFVFRVKADADKIQIKRAVQFLFKVEVDSVRVLNVKGKVKRFGKFMGKRSDWKKAYVKLKPGQEINLGTTA